MKPKYGDRPRLSRRDFIKNLALSGALLQTEPRTKPPAIETRSRTTSGLIDRQKLVSRHSPIIRRLEPLSPLSVGNGEFAFTADVTGLQSFPEDYDRAMPLCTMSQWGWQYKRRIGLNLAGTIPH
ncbi:MAG TPA: twin-arginine translocation signal domain-containing protein [Blastocatellia bacterium]|nr:twin-arginine translocation signal domain-containing protein [Blastocatellia bacterium]